jgi:hypothetical protein
MSYRNWFPEIGIGIGVLIAILLALMFGELVRQNAILLQANLSRNLGTSIQREHGARSSEASPHPRTLAGPTGSDTADKQQRFSIPITIIEKPHDTESRQETERRAEEREKNDLEAQRSMAKYARKMLAPAWWEVGIGFLGAVLLAVSLIWSARATKAANRAARAAQDVLKAERAWITPDDLGREIDDIKKQLGFTIVWTNSGRSPALNVESWCDIRIGDIAEEVPPKFERGVSQKIVRGMIIGQGANATSGPVYISGEDAVDFMNRRKVAYIYSHCVYNDIFDKSEVRLSEVCVRVEFRGIATDQEGRKREVFSIGAVGSQNSAT